MNHAVFIADIPQQMAYHAFCGTSFSPEKQGESCRNDYAATMAADYEKMRQNTEKGGTLAILDAEFSRYREGYAKRYRAWLSSHSNCISSFIAGPSNFPVARAEKRSRIADNRMREIIEFRAKGMSAALRNLRPDLRPIMAGDADAIDRLTADIETAERIHARMKTANAAIRKHAKAGSEAQITALIELGFSDRVSAELIKPDFCGRIGFADYQLTNNGANIRRIRARLEQITAAKATPDKTIERDELTIEDAPADNRIRLFFSGKPEAEVRDKLKRAGFRWAPSIGAWQAYRSHNAMQLAQSFVTA